MQNKNIIVKNKSHSRMILSGIYNACRCKIKENSLLNKCVEDPRLQASGMTPNLTGFTLIELLVVVLIIGILAAVAVPQYQQAVLKSRVSARLPFLKAIANRQRIYYLEHGIYARNLDALGLTIPAECTDIQYNYYGQMLSCGNDFIMDMNSNAKHVTFNYCPNNNASWEKCEPKRIFNVGYAQEYSVGRCNAMNSAKGTKICKTFSSFQCVQCK